MVTDSMRSSRSRAAATTWRMSSGCTRRCQNSGSSSRSGSATPKRASAPSGEILVVGHPPVRADHEREQGRVQIAAIVASRSEASRRACSAFSAVGHVRKLQTRPTMSAHPLGDGVALERAAVQEAQGVEAVAIGVA